MKRTDQFDVLDPLVLRRFLSKEPLTPPALSLQTHCHQALDIMKHVCDTLLGDKGLHERTMSCGRLRDDPCDEDWIFDRQMECASANELRAAADKAWSKQISGLLDRSPFYRRKFKEPAIDARDVSTVADLGRVPFTTKAELRISQEEHGPWGEHLAVPPGLVKRVYQTSGTTGNPSLLALTKTDLEETWGTIALRSYWGSGFHAHNSVVTNFGAGPFVAGTVHRTFERIGARTVPVGVRDTERVIDALRLGIADSLQATPSFVLYLISRFEKEGLDPREFRLVHINVGGEPGAGIPAIRERIETAFGSQLTEIMGLGDVAPSLFGECPSGGGMHYCGQGLVWMEMIDDKGEPIGIEPGARGEPVYTHLKREAMPLVRFRSGDLVEVQDYCECGRTSFRIRCIGRVDDMFIVRGVNVHPSAVQSVVSTFRPAVTGRSRVVLTGNAISVEPPVTVEVEIPETASEEDPDLTEKIHHAIRSKLIFTPDVRLVAESSFGEAGYKTRSLIRVPAPDA
jgi:phenylacetate-CoA ligase